MSSDNKHVASPHIPDADEQVFPELEEDQTIAPRPEEDLADVLRAEPDTRDHSHDGDGAAEG